MPCSTTGSSDAGLVARKEFLNGDAYTGRLSCGLPNGRGTYRWADGSVYDGDWANGERQGKGTFTWPSGAVYDGEWYRGKMHGMGEYKGVDGTWYKGGWNVGKKCGLGTKVFANKDVYGGLWKEGIKEGLGRYTWADGSEYLGEWRGGLMSGRGTLVWANGDRYDGQWLEGLEHGKGLFTWANGACYEGVWKKGLKDGKGLFYPPGCVKALRCDRHGEIIKEFADGGEGWWGPGVCENNDGEEESGSFTNSRVVGESGGVGGEGYEGGGRSAGGRKGGGGGGAAEKARAGAGGGGKQRRPYRMSSSSRLMSHSGPLTERERMMIVLNAREVGGVLGGVKLPKRHPRPKAVRPKVRAKLERQWSGPLLCGREWKEVDDGGETFLKKGEREEEEIDGRRKLAARRPRKKKVPIFQPPPLAPLPPLPSSVSAAAKSAGDSAGESGAAVGNREGGSEGNQGVGGEGGGGAPHKKGHAAGYSGDKKGSVFEIDLHEVRTSTAAAAEDSGSGGGGRGGGAIGGEGEPRRHHRFTRSATDSELVVGGAGRSRGAGADDDGDEAPADGRRRDGCGYEEEEEEEEGNAGRQHRPRRLKRAGGGVTGAIHGAERAIAGAIQGATSAVSGAFHGATMACSGGGFAHMATLSSEALLLPGVSDGEGKELAGDCAGGGHKKPRSRRHKVLMREYEDGVLVKETVKEVVVATKKKKGERINERVRHKFELKKQGEYIMKTHRSYFLMLNLQLGIRYTVGKVSNMPHREICPEEDFGPKAVIYQRFPKAGSRNTPPHHSPEFSWKDYCPFAFRRLREMFGIDASEYMMSICGNDALRQLPSPGKSGSVFFLSNDDKFIIKTMNKSEMTVLLNMLERYYRHVERYENTLLTKFFGLHRVRPFGGKSVRFVVMGNLFCTDLAIHRRYDLKGSTLGRSTDKSNIDVNTTLKDLDLEMVFKLEEGLRERLVRQLEADCQFLEEQRIMDYSLLLGLHYRSSKRQGGGGQEGGGRGGVGDARSPSPHSGLPPRPRKKTGDLADEENGEEAGGGGGGGGGRRNSMGNHWGVEDGGTNTPTPGGTEAEMDDEDLSIPMSGQLVLLQPSTATLKAGTGAGRDVRKSWAGPQAGGAGGVGGSVGEGRGGQRNMLSPAVISRAPKRTDTLRPMLGSDCGTDALAFHFGRSKVQLGVNMAATAISVEAGTLKETEPKQVKDVVLYFGIIDILQEYDMRKWAENAIKSVQYDGAAISAVDPALYAHRFKEFMFRAFA
ncbi:hypothetical protein CBR_g18706 [Chara braunii]|uniref:1-phosphatidylinositol-4-phosphate 5-kinase n=1 Tax=Chara braunii TaxID=69332 RepID=A0A388KW49_CHABU|nr:hypothetical protein CBR_g18706 [Chara braunii]|eukprot:GBG74295.1 hypothetical protein CBR_g18706 [Chara braunii]